MLDLEERRITVAVKKVDLLEKGVELAERITTPSIWFLVGVPAVPVAIGHVCAYVLAQERAPDSIPGAPTN